MSDSQEQDTFELTVRQQQRHDKLPTPALPHVASPSPAKARRRPVTERPSLPTANVAPVKLPSELFAIATSRSSQGDLALSKALDGIQAAATRLETERTKLVIQSQELQIWDMAREEELVLLRAENEQLEQQLGALSEKVTKGLGRDGVVESLQYALRKARMEREAEVREADLLFNQLQEAKAAAMELQELRAAFSTALTSLGDEWSTVPLLSEEARELRARADAAAQDPTNLGSKDMTTLLRGVLSLAKRGAELQQETQTLRGEKTALQQALDAAHQQLEEQADALRRHLTDGQPESSAAHKGEGNGELGNLPHGREPEIGRVPELGPTPHASVQQQQTVALQELVSELQSKLAEYRSYLQDNQEEIERLQEELKRLRLAQETGQELDAQASFSRVRALQPGRQVGGSAAATARAPEAASQRQSYAPPKPFFPGQPPHMQQALGTPTRHVPSSSSPMSTVNYGSPPPARGSPMSHQAAADFAIKVAELQELALRAQQQAADREAETVRQQEADLEALRQQLSEQKDAELQALTAQLTAQHAAALQEAQRREADLVHQQSRALVDVEAKAAKLSAQHAEALTELQAQMTKLTGQHAEALAECDAKASALLQQRLQEREAELERKHAEALAQVAAQAAARSAEAVEAQAAQLARVHAAELREAEARLEAAHTQHLREAEERLTRGFAEQQAARDAEARRKHAERLAEQAAQLAQLHAEQAAQMGMLHAEALAEREAQLLDQFERQLVEREGNLANAHADQLRDLEARFAAQAAQAADEREAQLRQQFTEQLAEAMRQQQENLAAQAEARLQEAGRAGAAAQPRLEEDARRRESELAVQLQAQRLRIEELEQQLTEMQSRIAMSKSRLRQVQVSDEVGEDVDAASESSAVSAQVVQPQVEEQQPEEREAEEQLHEQQPLAAEDQVQRLARQSEQLQRYADELEAVFNEAERRREEAVAEVERQYVEVVARLGREHEQATVEVRAAHELREANLRRALERQVQEARDAGRRHSEHLKKLQVQLTELMSSLKEERERHNASTAALEERAALLATELGAAHRRDRGARLEPAPSRGPQGLQHGGERQSESEDLSRPAAGASTAGRLGSEHLPASSTSALSGADSWVDGQALFWPAAASAPDSHSSSETGSSAEASRSSTGITAGGHAGHAVGATPEAALSSDTTDRGAAVAGPEPTRLHPGREEATRQSEPDLACNLLRVLRGLESEDAGGSGARLWGTSIEFDTRRAPRQELLGRADGAATASKEAVAETVTTGLPWPSPGSSPADPEAIPSGEDPSGGLDPVRELSPAPGAEAVGSGPQDPSLGDYRTAGGGAAAEAAAVGVGSTAEQRRTDGADEWGALLTAPQVAVPVLRRPPSFASGAGVGLGYMSEAATSVSTDTEYNSETEFYVDDEDDDEHRGRALAAALAQSPRVNQPELPPLLQELQRRRTTQSTDDSPGELDSAEADVGTYSHSAGRFGTADGNHQTGASDLEATLSGGFPVVDARLMGPPSMDSAAPAPAATGGVAAALVDLEATLSGPFPPLGHLPRLAQPRQAAPTAATARVAGPNDARLDGDAGPNDEADPSRATGPPNRSAVFSFPGPPSGGPSWDGMPVGGGQVGAPSSAGAEADRSSHEAGEAQLAEPMQPLIDLTASIDSFEFVSGGRTCPAPSASDSTLAQPSEFTTDGPGLSHSAPMPAGGRDREPLAAAADVDLDSIGGSSSKAEPNNEGRGRQGSGTGDDDVARGDGSSRRGWDERGGIASPTTCSLPPLPSPRPPLHSPELQVWVDLTDDGESGTDGGDEGSGDAEGEGAGVQAGWGVYFGGEAPQGDAGPRAGPPQAGARSAVRLTPLMLPNPLFAEGEEVSPPWSVAEWNATGTAFEREAPEEGASLPSTPGSGSSESGSGSSGSGSTGQGPALLMPHAADRSSSDEGTEGSRTQDDSCSAAASEADAEAEAEAGAGHRGDVGVDEQVVEKKLQADDSDDDMRSLLAAGATLSSSERRRRHRRRMGDVPPFLPLSNHPIDLLRQGWEFSGGVASPISPRSASRQARPPAAAETAPQVTTPSPSASPPRRPPIAPLSPGEQRRQREMQLQELLPLHALQHGRSSPPSARRSGVSSPSSARASQLRSPAASSLGTLSHAGGRPRTPSRKSGSADDESQPGPAAEAGALVLAASPATLSIGSPLPLAAAGLPMSPLEARQRSRQVLGRARSRVAELEGQCRALALSLQPAAGEDGRPSDAEAELAGPGSYAVRACGPQRYSGDGDWQLGRGRGVAPAEDDERSPQGLERPAAEVGRVEGSSMIGNSSSTGNSNSSSSVALALVQQPPAAPAEVVGALEDLRDDLSELEVLHHFNTLQAAVSGPAPDLPRTSVDGSAGVALPPDSRPSVLLLAGLAGGAIAAAAAAAAAAKATTEAAQLMPSSSQPGAPTSESGRGQSALHGSPGGWARQVAAGQSPLAAASAAASAAAAMLAQPTAAAMLRRPPSSGASYTTEEQRITGSLHEPLSAKASVSATRAPAAAAAVSQAAAPASHGSGASASAGTGYSLPQPLPLPLPSGSQPGSLDPALVALLQMSIQAQVQGQLGQLEAKIAELQRQNEALLAAATAASTPATPVPPTGLLRRSGPGGAAALTPLPFTLSTAARASTTATSAAAAAGGGPADGDGDIYRVRQLDGRASQPSGDAAAAVRWSGGVGGSWGSAVGGSGGPHLGSRPNLPVDSDSPDGGGFPAQAPSGAFQAVDGAAWTAVRLPAAAPVLTPAQAGLRAAGLGDALAGPYSPEELSQLPPTVQLFAPPQLRAAALAAVREHFEVHGRTH